MKKLTTLVAVVAISGIMAFGQGRRNAEGQGPGTPPDPQQMIEMRVNFMASMLGLTDAQKTQAKTIFTGAFEANQNIRTDMQAARKALAEAVKANSTGAIDQIAAETGKLTGQSIANDSKAQAAFYQILTPEQQAKLDAMPHGGPRGGGMGQGMGPGGPGMGGGMGPGGGPRQR